MRVALYMRVSTKDKGQDTENQAIQLKKFCSVSNHEIVAEYIDKASASGKVERDEFKQLLESASKREFDLVLFWSLDRFSREGARETLNYLQMLTDYGVAYKSYTEQYLDTCGMFKDAVISILATIAKQERIRISERVKAGMDRAKQSGLKMGRKPLAVKRGISPETVAALRCKGLTVREVASELGVSVGTAYSLVQKSSSIAPPDSDGVQAH